MAPKLSDTTRAMLTSAATREDHLVRPPQLPVAAARQVVRSLLNNALIEEVPAATDDPAYAWRTDDNGAALVLQATDQGLAADGAPGEPQSLAALTEAVLAFLAEEGCNATIAEEAEVQTMLADGHANGRPAARVAGDIIAWLAETQADTEKEAAAAEDASAQEPHPADNAAVAREVAAVVGALDAAPTAPARATLRQAAQAVLDAWNDEA